MDNTPFSKKCEILGYIHAYATKWPKLRDFCEQYDVGLWYATGQDDGDVVVTQKGQIWVDETWDELLELLDVPYGIEFQDARDFLDYTNASEGL
jgi:hypothetical protein